jgi:hypothetical protein
MLQKLLSNKWKLTDVSLKTNGIRFQKYYDRESGNWFLEYKFREQTTENGELRKVVTTTTVGPYSREEISAAYDYEVLCLQARNARRKT